MLISTIMAIPIIIDIWNWCIYIFNSKKIVPWNYLLNRISKCAKDYITIIIKYNTKLLLRGVPTRLYERANKKIRKIRLNFCRLYTLRTAVAFHFHDCTNRQTFTVLPSQNLRTLRSSSLSNARGGGFISFLKLLELCTHTRVMIIIIIIIRTVGKRDDVFLRIFIAPACLLRIHIYIYYKLYATLFAVFITNASRAVCDVV